jgi:predicted TIM-barrel fold metal-dependent hydrolase
VYRLISADSHVVEPPDLFERRLPQSLRSRAPRIEPVSLRSVAVSGSEYRDLARADRDVSHANMPAAYSDPQARIEAQDRAGIDAEVLYPFPPLWDEIKQLDDVSLRLACYRAYNDWIAEFCATAPDRLVGVAKIPNTGLADAVAEVRRAEGMGLRGVLLDALPSGADEPQDEDDEFWSLVTERGLPVSIHRGLGAASTAPDFTLGPGRRPQVASVLVPPLAGAGVFERYPQLKIVIAHANCGWVPHWAEGLDSSYLRQAVLRSWSLPNPDRLPSEYRRSWWFTFQHDRTGVLAREYIGVAHMMWASHFPLDGADWPDDRARAELVVQEVAAADRERLLATNCARLYRLPGYEAGFPAEELEEYKGLLLL